MVLKNPLITIIIPNYNGKRFLDICLSSVIQQTFKDFNVIVVDNGSTDDSVDFIKKNYPDIQLIEFHKNLGFSVAINEGIKQSMSEYVFLLNNDTELTPGFLDEILSALNDNNENDYCAPKILNYHRRNILDGAGDGIFKGGAGYRLGTLEKDNGMYNEKKTVFGACAGAAIYRRSFFKQVGYFDEDFFAYLEDVDINFRANLLGLKCLYVPAAKIYHIGSATTGSTLNDFTVQLTTKNIFSVIIKNYPMPILLKCMPEILLYHIAWFFFVLKKDLLMAYIRGINGALLDLPKMWRKRKEMLSRKSISNELYLSKINNSERDVMNSILRRRKNTGKFIWPIVVYKKLFL